MDTRKLASAASAGVNILWLSSIICHINELLGTESLDYNAEFCVSIQQKSIQRNMKGLLQKYCKTMAYISDELTLFPSHHKGHYWATTWQFEYLTKDNLRNLKLTSTNRLSEEEQCYFKSYKT